MLHLFMVYPEFITSRQVDKIQVYKWTRYE